jgi:hypothetical protein
MGVGIPKGENHGLTRAYGIEAAPTLQVLKAEQTEAWFDADGHL